MTSSLNVKSTVRPDTADRHLRKYTNKNIIHRFTLSRFFDSIAHEILQIDPQKTLEFGCGEGLFLEQLKQRNIYFNYLVGIDIREDALSFAKKLHPEYHFLHKDILRFNPDESYDLVIASQVMEHLPFAFPILEKLVSLSHSYVMLTVPWEPWFSLMNFIRGRDILRFGNHPEHINHWNVKTFSKFVSKSAGIEKVYTVFPFIILIAKKYTV